MEHTRASIALLTVVFIALIISEPLAQLVQDLRSGSRPAALDIFSRAPTAENLRSYEDALREQSVVANKIRPALQYWRFTSMGDAGANGMVGREGWLFYKPGVQFLVEPWQAEQGEDVADALAAIESFRDQLAQRSIALLVLVVPGKESVYPNLLAAGAQRPVNGHVTTFLETLRDRGVHAMYLMPEGDELSRNNLFLKQDTHWTPAYAKECAERVAAFVTEQGWTTTGTAQFKLKQIALKRHGDILRMAKSHYVLNAIPPEEIICEQVIESDTGQPYHDDPDAPILVLGDSFLRIFERDEPGSAGFVSHFARALGQPVSSLISDGGASTLVRQELRRKAELLRGKKLVIWEFVDRDLRFGTDGWQDVPLGNSN
ncbi:MAG: hypothetical protein SGI88_14800 [Candidatus Hydrogenedentes bacterium]|nr:hypothetical protein [Candidatus Hydrogenedentota bacterium]